MSGNAAASGRYTRSIRASSSSMTRRRWRRRSATASRRITTTSTWRRPARTASSRGLWRIGTFGGRRRRATPRRAARRGASREAGGKARGLPGSGVRQGAEAAAVEVDAGGDDLLESGKGWRGDRVGAGCGGGGGMPLATGPALWSGGPGQLRGSRRGRGRAGEVEGRCHGNVREEGTDEGGRLDGGEDAQAVATAGTGENIETERPVHQRRPGPGVRGDDGAGRAREGGVWGRAAVGEDVGAPAGARGEDAVG